MDEDNNFDDDEDTRDGDYGGNNGGSFGGLVGLIILYLIVAWFFHWWPFAKDYSKPWFEGGATQVVCSIPYSDSDKCYNLLVHSNGEEIEVINFPNGGYREIDYTECSKAASFYDFDKLCKVWDTKGDVWDILPYGSDPDFRDYSK